MAQEPLVYGVMLTRDRGDMAARAVASFHMQTYKNKRLTVVDTSAEPAEGDYHQLFQYVHRPTYGSGPDKKTIGYLRNIGASHSAGEIICHFDDDDWSHPNRLAEQVELLLTSGAECVGYNDMVFWQTCCTGRHADDCDCGLCGPGRREVVYGGDMFAEAWVYRHGKPNYCIGTSLMYWRHVWQRKSFADLPKPPLYMEGEDTMFTSGLKTAARSCLLTHSLDEPLTGTAPRMIASVHASNTTSMVSKAIAVKDTSMRRAPELDAYCRERMKL